MQKLLHFGSDSFSISELGRVASDGIVVFASKLYYAKYLYLYENWLFLKNVSSTCSVTTSQDQEDGTQQQQRIAEEQEKQRREEAQRIAEEQERQQREEAQRLQEEAERQRREEAQRQRREEAQRIQEELTVAWYVCLIAILVPCVDADAMIPRDSQRNMVKGGRCFLGFLVFMLLAWFFV